jgi:hypothetical protein
MALSDHSCLTARTSACLGQAVRSLPGEPLCGDQLGWWLRGERLRLALADGLGHGSEAHAAAATAMRQIAMRDEVTLDRLFAHCDQALIDTRGAALAIVDILPGESLLMHASVGNVRTLLIRGQHVRRLGGARGIVGTGLNGLHPECLPIAPGDWVLIFSDGLPENAGIAECLADAQPSDGLAERLVAQWCTDRDDASLLLYRHA